MRKFGFLFTFVLAISLGFIACDETPDVTIIKGCTDSEAENYDATATEEDNTCAYARDKFLGVYSGTLQCGAPLPEMSTFTMDISESLTGSNTVIVEFKDINTPLPILTATASGNMLVVTKDTFNIALNPDLPDITTEVVMSGEATITDDEQSIDGIINAQVLGFPTSCTFTATRN